MSPSAPSPVPRRIDTSNPLIRDLADATGGLLTALSDVDQGNTVVPAWSHAQTAALRAENLLADLGVDPMLPGILPLGIVDPMFPGPLPSGIIEPRELADPLRTLARLLRAVHGHVEDLVLDDGKLRSVRRQILTRWGQARGGVWSKTPNDPELYRLLPGLIAKVKLVVTGFRLVGLPPVPPETLTSTIPTPIVPTPTPRPCIISLGERQYCLDDGRPVTVSASENLVLLAYLDDPRSRRQAASVLDTAQLKDRTRLEDPGKEIRRLAKGPLGTAIDCPGKRRKGTGYHVNIRAAENPPDIRRH
jgi:hypothetical protein